MNLCRAVAVSVAVALLAAPAAAGQIVDPATGSIVGTVRDVSGAVAPAVEIIVTGPPLMTPRKAVTGGDGQYRVTGLPPGDYTLSFALRGFTTREQAVRVSLSFTSTLDVKLTLEAQREEVAVTARGSVLDRHSAAIAETFDSRQLDALPTSRSMAGLVALVPAMMMSTFEVGGSVGLLNGSFNAYGRGGSPRHTIEGIVVTGLFGNGFTPDYGAFEEVSVLTAGHGPEWPGLGVNTQFVTKSGGNRYAGTVYAGFENRRWQSSNVDADQIARVAPSGGGLSAGQVNQLWQYHDVNADTGGFLVRDRLWWYASVRDQKVSSRVVNFPAEPYATRLKNYDGKVTYRIAPGSTLVAYGQRVINDLPHRLDPFGFAGTELSGSTAINESAASAANQRSRPWMWKAEWDSVISDALLFEVRTGQFASETDWKPYSAAPRFEDIDTLQVSGGNRDWHSSARRNQLFGALSYFKDGWWGSHHFKFGGEAIRFTVRETWVTGYPGNVVHVLRSGSPSFVFLFDVPTRSETGVWSQAAYASDSWRLKNRLTLMLGLRFDRQRVFLPAQEHPFGSPTAQPFPAVDNLIDWNTVVPRIAAAWDVTGDGRTLAKLVFGRYRAAVNANVGFNSNPNGNVWWAQYDWNDPNASGVWEPGEEGRLRRRRGGTATESMDPALQLSVSTEAGAWIERELPAGIGLRTGAVWRHEDSPFARQNISQPFDAFTVPVTLRDPGPDGTAGTPDDGPELVAYDVRPEFIGVQAINVLRNVPGATSEHWTWEIEATRRARGRWSVGAAFAHTWSRDQASVYAEQAVRGNTYPLTPNDLINAGPDGRHTFTTWTAKAHGTYEAPWGVRVTPVLRHQSGQPFGRTFTTDSSQLRYNTVTVLAEPVGARRMDHVTLVDVRLEKRLPLKGTSRLSAMVDVFNCFNANPEQNTIWASGASFLRPVSIVSPRIARLGLSLHW